MKILRNEKGMVFTKEEYILFKELIKTLRKKSKELSRETKQLVWCKYNQWMGNYCFEINPHCINLNKGIAELTDDIDRLDKCMNFKTGKLISTEEYFAMGGI